MADRAIRGKDAGRQHRRAPFLDRRPGDGVLEAEGPDARAHEAPRRGPRTRAPRRRPRPGSGCTSLAALHADAQAGRRAPDQLEGVDADPARRAARRRSPPAPARGGAGPPRGAPSTSAAPARCHPRTAPAPRGGRRPSGTAPATRRSPRRSRRGCPSPCRAGWWPGTPCPGPGDTAVSLVPSPRRIGRSPVAMGSSVPPWPTLGTRSDPAKMRHDLERGDPRPLVGQQETVRDHR